MNSYHKVGTMLRAKKPLLVDLNEHLLCKLCKGYFVDATTIIECLHTFCRSCIVKYLETTKYCPICDVQVHKSKPLLSLRPDKIIQDIVYKLVPRHHQNELRRRREFHKKHQDIKLSASEECFENSQCLFLSPEEELCVTLTYYGSLGKPRYLRCPSAVSVMVLQKLIRAKFGLSESHHVDILHDQDCLNPCYTLMDIMYIYKLSKLEPLDLTYRIYEYMAKKLKTENQECKIDKETCNKEPVPNNNNWKEVQLRISENGEMSITGIQDSMTTQSFSDEMIEVLDSKPKSPVMTCCKKKDIPEPKILTKPKQKCINIISDTTIRPFTPEVIINSCLISNASSKGTMNVTTSVAVPSTNSVTKTVFTNVNSTKCSVSTENPSIKEENNSEEIVETEPITNKKVDTKDIKNKMENMVKGIKRKFDDLNNGDNNTKPTNNNKRIELEVHVSEANDKKVPEQLEITVKIEKLEEETSVNNEETKPTEITSVYKNSNSFEEKSRIEVTLDKPQSNIKTSAVVSTADLSHSKTNNDSKQKEEVDNKPLLMNVAPPKPSTKYQGASQPCYMPKTSFNPVLNIPKLHQSNAVAKSDIKSSPKTVTSVKIEAKAAPSSCSGTSNPSLATKQKLNAKVKTNAPMGYKTLKDPPKSWNSQISKANLSKAQPDRKYSDLKNVRPAKFFKMRNNMLRFLGNPASGVKPMYSLQGSPEQQETPLEKCVDNKEIKKHSIVKIDPKTLKPISERAPEASSLSGQISATTDLKINTSSVSIFNPLKLQSNSPKSERKSPKSPQSPKHKSSPSPSPPVPKRDKPNLNFTPPNPFVPNLSSQTVNPNQFLCNPGPPGFPSYDPRVMAAYHNLFYGTTMGFPPSPLSYHLGGLDIAQRGKGFDISKMVGMQQQASSSKSPSSPQSTPKLDVPIVPPQVPYQPRPSPMTSSRSPNMTSSSKRPSKDVNKNEKSLQNAVEKLTLNRAKQINSKAAEAMNKDQVSNVKRNDNKDNRKEENEVKRTQFASVDRLKQPHNEAKASSKEEDQKLQCRIDKAIESLNTNSKSESDVETSSNKNESHTQKDPNHSGTSKKPSKIDENDKLCETRTDSDAKNESSCNRDNKNGAGETNLKSSQDINSNQQNCVGMLGKSNNDSKNVDVSVKEDSKAGSRKNEGFDGNK